MRTCTKSACDSWICNRRLDSTTISALTTAKPVHDIGMGVAETTGESFASAVATKTSNWQCSPIQDCVTKEHVYTMDPTSDKRCKNGKHTPKCSTKRPTDLACCRAECNADSTCTGFVYFSDGGCQISSDGCGAKLPVYNSWVWNPTDKKHESLRQSICTRVGF